MTDVLSSVTGHPIVCPTCNSDDCEATWGEPCPCERVRTPLHVCIRYKGSEWVYDETRPGFYTITCPDGYVSGPHCVSTANSNSVIQLLEGSGHHDHAPTCATQPAPGHLGGFYPCNCKK